MRPEVKIISFTYNEGYECLQDKGVNNIFVRDFVHRGF